MNWTAFYLVCFGVGFTMSLLSLLSGALHLHLPAKLHLHWTHAGGVSPAAGGVAAKGGHKVGWFNSAAMLAFLAWFGGVGYLLTSHYRVWYVTALLFAILAGLAGALGVSWFFVDVLQRHETILDEADYRMEGMVGRVSIPVRASGTGEVIFVQGGVRRSAGARSEDGKPIERGAEVVIARYERGIAYLRRWEDFTNQR